MAAHRRGERLELDTPAADSPAADTSRGVGGGQPDTSLPGCPSCGYRGLGRTPGYAAAAVRRHSCAVQQVRGPRSPEQSRARCGQQQTRGRALAYGRWEPLVDAQPVRDHVRALTERGFSIPSIAAAAGLTDRGQYQRVLLARPPARRCRPAIAAALRAVTPDAIRPALVDATGTRRRLRALLAIGHSHLEMASRLGTTPQRLNVVVHDTGPVMVNHRTDAGVRVLYDELWDVPGGSSRARAAARARGWVAPLGWDDDDIDDPAAKPARPGPVTVSRRHRRLRELTEDLAFLLDTGTGYAGAAARLEVTEDYLRYTLPARTASLTPR